MNYFKQFGTPKIIGGLTYKMSEIPVVTLPESVKFTNEISPRRTTSIAPEIVEEQQETPIVQSLPEITNISITTPDAPVATSTTATNPIVKQVMSTSTGKHVFKHKNMDVGNMKALLDEAAKYGISFRVTSGVRPGAKTKQGKTSHHAHGNAIDITPVKGETYADLANKIRNAPGFVKWMQDHGYGIYDETTPKVMARTGASGAHWHIGPDKVAIAGLKQILV